MSVTGIPPLDGSGRPLRAYHISVEGQFVYIGGDEYMLRMADGKFAIVGRNASGTMVPYRIRINAKTIDGLLFKPTTPVDEKLFQ